jgi:tetratricopeptide (TPR) repeat protein
MWYEFEGIAKSGSSKNFDWGGKKFTFVEDDYQHILVTNSDSSVFIDHNLSGYEYVSGSTFIITNNNKGRSLLFVLSRLRPTSRLSLIDVFSQEGTLVYEELLNENDVLVPGELDGEVVAIIGNTQREDNGKKSILVRDFVYAINADISANAIFSDDSVLVYNLGTDFYSEGKYDEAILYFKKAIEIDPTHEKAYNNLGIIYATKKDYVTAEQYWNQLVQINPRNAKAYNNLGSNARDQKQYQKAIPLLKKAAELDSSFANPHQTLGFIYDQLGQKEEAIKEFEIAIILGAPDKEMVQQRLVELKARR